MERIDSTKVAQKKLKKNLAFSSSAIFYVYADDENDSRVSFLNHYLLKRNIEKVSAVLTYRDISGKISNKISIEITEGKSFSYSTRENVGNFEGSVEVEFFSATNIVVPYTAATIIYDFKNSICQLHSVSRVYSKDEMENRRITIGEEAGWTCRDSSDGVYSQAIITNGFKEIQMPTTFTVTNFKGETKYIDLGVIELKSYQTFKLIPKEHLNISDFLESKEGHISISFKADTFFPRFICGNIKSNNNKIEELQMTHSNFNYFKVETDRLDNQNDIGIIDSPFTSNTNPLDIIVYPNFKDTEDIYIDLNDTKTPLYNDKINKLSFSSGSKPVVKTSDSRGLPNRLVAGLIVNWDDIRLPSECSLGMVTQGYSYINKHWYWGLSDTEDTVSTMSIFTHDDFLPLQNYDNKAVLSLYDLNGICGNKTLKLSKEPITLNTAEIYDRKPKGDVWYTVVSDYPVISVFSSIEDKLKKSGSIEHSF